MEFVEERWKRTAPRVTHCPKGHEYTPENTYIWKRSMRCRACIDIKRGWIPQGGKGLITEDDRRKIRSFRGTTKKKKVSIEKYKQYMQRFKAGPNVKAGDDPELVIRRILDKMSWRQMYTGGNNFNPGNRRKGDIGTGRGNKNV